MIYLEILGKGRMEKYVERWYPLVISTITGILIYILSSKYRIDIEKITSDLFPNTINLGGIVIGFLAAAKSILFSIENSYIVQQFKKANIYKKLINYFMDAINLGFILVIASIIGSLINFENPNKILYVYFSFWAALIVATGLSSYRVIRIFSDTIKDS